MSETNTGVSPVIGVILMVAVTVALVALVTVIVFDIGGNVSNSPDATVQLEEQSGSVTATVLRNENVDEFRLENPTEGNVTIPGEPGSTGSLPAGSGRYKLIAVLPDGSEETAESIDSTPDGSSGGSGDGSSGGSSQTISGTVTGSTVENATVQEIRQNGSVGNQTTTDSTGNYSLTVSDPNTSQIRVSFVETKPSVEVSGSNNISAAGVKTVGGSSTVDFNFSASDADVVSETVNIEGIDEVRYLTGNNSTREIANLYQLQAMNESKSSDYRLVSDVNASQTESWNSARGFNPIGRPSTEFSGSLDGQGNEIENLVIDRGDPVGLFGSISADGEAINLSLVGANVTNQGGDFDGGGILVGKNKGTITNVSSSGTVVTEGFNTGGMVGINEGTINNSVAHVDLSEPENPSSVGIIGGLVGAQQSGGITENSSATGDVLIGTDDLIGGLVGSNGQVGSAEIINSHATGDVKGTEEVGGLAGDVQSFDSVIRGSYATGNVTGNVSAIGGLVGGISRGDAIENSYATGDVNGTSGADELGGFVGTITGSDVTINGSYAIGSVIGSGGSNKVGGFVGANEDGIISVSYASGTVTGNSSVGGFVGSTSGSSSISESYYDISPNNGEGTQLTTDQMQGSSATGNMSGFDFTNVWETVEASDSDATEDDYPVLQSLGREKQLGNR